MKEKRNKQLLYPAERISSICIFPLIFHILENIYYKVIFYDQNKHVKKLLVLFLDLWSYLGIVFLCEIQIYLTVNIFLGFKTQNKIKI